MPVFSASFQDANFSQTRSRHFMPGYWRPPLRGSARDDYGSSASGVIRGRAIHLRIKESL